MSLQYKNISNLYLCLHDGKADDSKRVRLLSAAVTLAIGCDATCDAAIAYADVSKVSTVCAYGKLVQVWMDATNDSGTTESVLLFAGKVLTVMYGALGSPTEIGKSCKVQLGSAAKFYDGVSTPQPYYISYGGSGDAVIDLATRRSVDNSKSAQYMRDYAYNGLQAGEKLIDVSQYIATIVDPPDNEEDTDFKLSSIFNWSDDLRPFIRTFIGEYTVMGQINPSILQKLGQQPPVQAFASELTNYFMTPVPRVREDGKLEIISSLGLTPSKDKNTTLSEFVGIIGYIHRPSPKKTDTTALAVVTPQTRQSRSTKLLYLMRGYYEDGKLKISITSRSNLLGPQQIKYTGPVRTVNLPPWLWDVAQADSNVRDNAAWALTTTYFAMSGLVADTLAIQIRFEDVPKIYNRVGEVFNLGLEVSDKITLQQGRLRALKYSISTGASGDSLQLSAEMDMDCVLNKDESAAIQAYVKSDNLLLLDPDENALDFQRLYDQEMSNLRSRGQSWAESVVNNGLEASFRASIESGRFPRIIKIDR